MGGGSGLRSSCECDGLFGWMRCILREIPRFDGGCNEKVSPCERNPVV